MTGVAAARDDLADRRAAAQARLYVAIDTADLTAATRLAARLGDTVGGIKVGLTLFSAVGPAGVRAVVEAAGGRPLFLDLKFHDIPNTVRAAVAAVAGALAPDLITVHAAGGGPMMAEARAAAAAASGGRTRVVAVTVLTSLDADDLAAIGQDQAVTAQVTRLAKLARASGLDGVVTAPTELAAVRRAVGAGCLCVVPGVRPLPDGIAADGDADDQKRVMTPADAVGAGADLLVVGRPITQAADPAAAARAIVATLAASPPGRPTVSATGRDR